MNRSNYMKAEQVRMIIRGIIAREMGETNQGLISNSAEKVFEYICSLDQVQFRNIKTFLKPLIK